MAAGFTTFPDPLWDEIVSAVRAHLSADVDWQESRRELGQAGREFFEMHERRLKRPPRKQELKRLDEDLQRVRELQTRLSNYPTEIVILNLLERRLLGWQELYTIWVPAFSRRADAYRSLFYWRIAFVWTDLLHGKLKYSRDRAGKPHGPLIRFMSMVLKAVLGKTPGPARIAQIIERERSSTRISLLLSLGSKKPGN